MSKKIVTLGEIMLRLSPPNQQRFVQADSLDVYFGGSESNVAVSLSNFGLTSCFVSKVPEGQIGQAAINHLRRYGVDTQFVNRGGERLGIYYLENGASVRGAHVIYDRLGSSIASAKLDEFDFDKIFSGAHWFHISGITPALSEQSRILTEAALKFAKSKGITTSMDLNYRKKLWSRADAHRVLSDLCQHVDICIGADPLLGFNPKDKELINGELTLDGFSHMFQFYKKEFGFKYIASIVRKSINASENDLFALAYDGMEMHQTREYKLQVVDRVGGGDAFAGGFIYGLSTGMSVAKSCDFGMAANAIKHSIPGDINHATVEEVLELMDGSMGGKVKR